MTETRLDAYLKSRLALADKALAQLFRPKSGEPKTIRDAMRYSIFAGGKRLRPILLMAAAEACGTKAEKVLKAAAAMEMIHTYSLIHDDLPAMDDDDLRRGKPTNHKVFGEAMAILAGDGLLTYAFEAAADNARALGLDARSTAELIRALAQGAGTQGMVGGQVADLEAEEWKGKNHGFNPARVLEQIHLRKTAALIAASLEAGAILAGASAAKRRALREYGEAMGLAFQIADDVLDVVGDKKKLGKNGSDAQNQKLTYAALYGLDKARAKARALVALAQRKISPFGPKGQILRDLADYVIARDR
ncbi:MAG: polyprenyl synthetase family protein [Elusimicrobia bacterium]|nr:polyprenyl synthetase family protein [Elusimicrobiota bacterium]